ncbi:MAG: NAD(P)-dependent oxidoreductase [bacterium]|nr:NAD(P)-dependent oxidoreductase [bacterium]
MRIAVFGIKGAEREILQTLLSGVPADYFEEVLNEQSASRAKDAEIISIFINDTASKEVLAQLPKLKLIVVRSTGYDNVDCVYAKQRGILVANAPTYGSRTVAEFAFGLIFSFSRKIETAHQQLKTQGDFSIEPLQGFDLEGKTLGVVGVGKIGREMIKLANAFQMKVLGCDPSPDMALAEEFGFEYVPLTELLSASDIITLHVPYLPDTHHLLNQDNMRFIKKGAYLINTARGEIVATEALIQSLKNGTLAGAGLDVLEGERDLKEEIHLTARPTHPHDFKTLLEDYLLLEMPNVIVTPHIAFYSKEAVRRIMELTATNIKTYIAGVPENLIKL